jgi:hypothetical protein
MGGGGLPDGDFDSDTETDSDFDGDEIVTARLSDFLYLDRVNGYIGSSMPLS